MRMLLGDSKKSAQHNGQKYCPHTIQGVSRLSITWRMLKALHTNCLPANVLLIGWVTRLVGCSNVCQLFAHQCKHTDSQANLRDDTTQGKS
jgi:hypothetical protein